MTELNGFLYTTRREDTENFKSIDVKKISETLDISKSDVKDSIKTLIDNFIIEKGSNDIVKDGYRFTF